jgi:hypothetical membrane protein
LFLVHYAMWVYRGGTIHEPHLQGYSFTYNFFSDLGRNLTPGGENNFPSNFIFKTALILTGVCISLFFSVLPGIFQNPMAKAVVSLSAVAGIAAGVSYIGIGWVPYDINYWRHHFFVRSGFIAFLSMSFLLAVAIFLEKGYPNRYGYALLVFCLILFSQILLMFLGERSWRSNDALFRQATAQKVVVYAEILCMIYQTFGAIGHLRRQKAVSSPANGLPD